MVAWRWRGYLRRAGRILATGACCVTLAMSRPPDWRRPQAGPKDRVGRKFVAVATISPPDNRGDVALKQLRCLAHGGDISGAVLKPLAALQGYMGPFEWLVWETLAAGGEPVEMSCLQALERSPDDPLCIGVLAIVEAPSKAATARLGALRPLGTACWFSRTAYALGMCVRGDRAEDWMAQVVDGILHPADPMYPPASYGLFMNALAAVAPRLERSPELEEALWHSLGDERNEYRVFAVLPLLTIGSTPLSASRADLLERAIRTSWLKELIEPAFLVHLSLARMGADAKPEMEKALSEIGTMSREYRFAASMFGTPYVGTFMDPKLTGHLQEGLSSGPREVKLGALALVSAMGPDASAMLPALDHLVSDQDREVARDARKARVLVAGLNEEGEWVYKEDARLLGEAYLLENP